MAELETHCPANKAADILGDKWVLQILRAMTLGARRYSDFTAAMPKISPSVLSGRLKHLSEQGLIIKRGEGGQQAVYRLAPSGRDAQPIIMMLGEWGLKWAERNTKIDQIDVGATMWDIHQTLVASELPDGETVFAFAFDDISKHNQWWIVATQRSVDLCNIDPGKSVDLYVHTPLGTLVDVWVGEADLGEALRTESIQLTGERSIVESARHWFPLSPAKRMNAALAN